MAIVFDCPHCKTNYRLRDEFAGKTATCKNPGCRRVIPVPQPNAPNAPAAGKVPDIDALAAAAFADEPQATAVAEEMIPVTCARCDHHWQVEASKEGKNVLCPECRHANRVPLRKKVAAADWKTGGGGPSGAKRETGMDRAGAFASNQAEGISQQTAKRIVDERAREEEPEERRRRRIKWAAVSAVGIIALSIGGFFAFKTKREMSYEGAIGDAIREATEGKDATKDPRVLALVYRAAGEYRARNKGGDAEARAALEDLLKAKNHAARTLPETSVDRNRILADIAATMALLVGEKALATEVPKAIRETLQRIPVSEADLYADALRAITQRCAERQQPSVADDIARLLKMPEAHAQVALELLRINKDEYRGVAEKIAKDLTDSPRKDGQEPVSLQALRLYLGTPRPTPKGADPKKDAPPPAANPMAVAEAAALAGDFAKARQAADGIRRADERMKALAAVAGAILATNPTEAGAMLEAGAKETKGALSTWVSLRCCRVLAQLGKADAIETIAMGMVDEQAKSWARLEGFRATMSQAKSSKGDETWFDTIGDPTKSAAAARSREDVARHNAAAGLAGAYQKDVKGWTPGTVRPLGMTGLLLGRLDRDGK